MFSDQSEEKAESKQNIGSDYDYTASEFDMYFPKESDPEFNYGSESAYYRWNDHYLVCSGFYGPLPFRSDYDYSNGYSEEASVYSLDELKNQLKQSKNEIEKFKAEVKRLKAESHHQKSQI